MSDDSRPVNFNYPFPESKTAALRRKWLRTLTRESALSHWLDMILSAEETAKGTRCDYCMLAHQPAPNCVALGEDS